MSSIKISNLTFKYPGKSVLNNISCEIKSSTVNILVGLNGCGKTTLIKLLTGFLKPSAGVISIDGVDLRKISILERSRLIAYVPQMINSDNEFKVREYLSFSLANTLKIYQSPTEEQEKSIEKTAKLFGLGQFMDKKINELSGGERQIVAVCGAFVQNTPIIILDEPTSALDFKNQHLVLTIIKKRIKGKTVIFSSHNPNHGRMLGCNAVVIDSGIIRFEGPARQILSAENLREIYGKNICYSSEITAYQEITLRDD